MTPVLVLLSAPALVASLSPRTVSASRECSCACVKRPCPPCPCAAAQRPRRNRTGTARSASAVAVETWSYRMDSRAGAGDVSPASLAEKWRRIADSYDHVDGALERKLAGSERDTPSLDEEKPSGRRRGRTRSLVAAGAILLASAAAFVLGLSSSSSFSPMGEIISGAASTAWGRIVDMSGGGGHATGLASAALLSIRCRLPLLGPGNDLRLGSALRFLRTKAIPTSIALLKKFAIMEAWRRVWVVVFRTARQAWRSATKRVGAAAIPWKKYCPAWIRRGFKSLFVKAVQGSVDEAVGAWIGYVASTEYVAGWVAPSSSATNDVIESVGAENCLADNLLEATLESSFLEAAAENVMDAVTESDMIATSTDAAVEAAGEMNMAESVFEAMGEVAADALGESGLSDATDEIVAAAALPA